MISIQATTLRRMFEQVTPHMCDPEEYLPVISTVQLQARDGWLYAAATDRFTIAVSRREATTTENLTGYIPGHLVPALTAWLDGLAGLDRTISITLPAAEAQAEVILTTPGLGNFTVRYDTDDYEKFPDWRKLLHATLTCEPGPIPLTGFTAKFLARWQHAAEKLITWQEAPGKPLVLLDELGYFAGLHMPIGYHREGMTRQKAAGSWIAATARTATVDGLTYHLDQTWADRDGDVWTYTGDDRPDGTPLMAIEGLEDDPYPLDLVITMFGPLYATA